jgi:hypothetical protein
VRFKVRGLPLEPKQQRGARVRKWLSAGCALALICACVSPRDAVGQASASAADTSAPAAKSHPTSNPTTGTHSKATTAAADHTRKAKHTTGSKSGARKSGKKKTTARGQQKIEPERAQAIQEALIREHYLTGEAAGTWNQSSEEAMRRYQADHGWQSKTVPDARALISLGLGPSHDHLLNPESAMTTGPFSAGSASLTPASHSADQGARMDTKPVAPAPATAPEHDASGPQ